MKHLLPLAFAALAGMSHAATPFDVTANRSLISSNVIWSNIYSSDVYGPVYNSTPGKVRMFYDIRDQKAGYAGTENFWNRDWSLYVQAGSALGPNGPLGFQGPLSSIGPLYMPSFSYAWSSWLPSYFGIWNGSANFGSSSPYGVYGPLGYTGPLTEAALYTTMYHINESGGFSDRESTADYNDFPHHLDPSGIWGILGPAGPLGALGPLGPLGPNGYGASGLATIEFATGDYKSGSQVIRSLDVPYSTDASGNVNVRRIYDLVELYPRANLVTRQANPSQFVNDTSFSVDAVSPSCSLSYASADAHSYYFVAKNDQWVSLVLTNANAYAELDFDVFIKADPNGAFKTATNAKTWFGSPAKRFAVTSNAALFGNTPIGLQDFAVVRARKNEVFKVVVKPRVSGGTGGDFCGYLFHVTGTGFKQKVGSLVTDSTLFAPNRHSGGMTTYNITGPHQQGLMW